MTSLSRGFPKRQGTAAEYGATPPQAASGPSSSMVKSDVSLSKQEEAGAFLEYVHCHICSFPFYPDADQPARVFFMTSCGHIMCNDPGHNHKKERCTVCGRGGEERPIEVYVLDDQMPPELQSWFNNPAAEIQIVTASTGRTNFHIAELKRHIAYLSDKVEKRTAILMGTKEQIKAYRRLQEDYAKMEQREKDLLEENASLKRQIAFSTTSAPVADGPVPRRPPPMLQGHDRDGFATPVTHPAPFQHIPLQQQGYDGRGLAAVMEEDEQGSQDERGVQGSNKRPRMEQAPVYPRRLMSALPVEQPARGQPTGPPPPITQVKFDRFSRNAGNENVNINAHALMRTPLASGIGGNWQHDQGGYAGPQRPQSAMGPRTNIEQYRFDPNINRDGGVQIPRSAPAKPPLQIYRPSSARPGGRHEQGGRGHGGDGGDPGRFVNSRPPRQYM